MDLSIIIVNYNAKVFLTRCLDSICTNAPEISFEVFVVDNASNDGSSEMVRTRFPQVKLIANKENLGFARGNNLAIKRSSGRYVLLLNPDTEVYPGTLEAMVHFMEEHPEAGGMGCEVVNSDGTLAPSPQVMSRLGTAFAHIFRLKTFLPKGKWSVKLLGRFLGKYAGEFRIHDGIVREVDYINGCCFLVRRETIDGIGMLDDNIFLDYEDLDWCYRIKKGGWRIYFYPLVRITHHWGQSRKTIFRESFVRRYESMYYFYLKTYGKLSFYALKLIAINGFALRWFVVATRYLLTGFRRKEVEDELGAYRDVISLSFSTTGIENKVKDMKSSQKWLDAQRSEKAWWKQGPSVYGHFSKQYWADFLSEDSLSFDNFRDKRVLEVGCGPFGMIHYIENAFQKIGIEPLVLDYIEMGIGVSFNTPTVSGVGENLPLPNDCIDYVILCNVLDHARDPSRILSEAYRVLRNGGEVYLVLNVFSKYVVLFGDLLSTVDRPHPYHFTSNEIQSLFLESGFHIRKTNVSKMGRRLSFADANRPKNWKRLLGYCVKQKLSIMGNK